MLLSVNFARMEYYKTKLTRKDFKQSKNVWLKQFTISMNY